MKYLALLLTSIVGMSADNFSGFANKCQRITIEMCQDLPYQWTRFPNLVDDDNQRDAAVALATFDPLIHLYCSTKLKFFLCSVYVPMCSEKLPIAIGPCRPLCEKVRSNCEPVLREFGFPWPIMMNCSKFPPENNGQAMCMKGPVIDQSDIFYSEKADLQVAKPEKPSSICTPTSIYVNRTGKCVSKCDSLDRYSTKEQQVSSTLILSLCSLLLLFTLLILVVLIFYPSRRKSLSHPEICLFFSTFSGAVSASFYLFTLFNRSFVSCTDYQQVSILVSPGLAHIPCTLVGIFLYFFGSACRIWWLLFCWCWLLIFVRSRPDLIEARRFTLHVIAWAPSLFTIILILMNRAVNADPLSGLCFVGMQTSDSLLIFVAFREFLLLSLTILALLCGFFGKKMTSKNDICIGFVGVLYVPFGFLLVYASFNQFTSPDTMAPFPLALFGPVCELSLGVLAASCSFCWVLSKTDKFIHRKNAGFSSAYMAPTIQSSLSYARPVSKE